MDLGHVIGRIVNPSSSRFARYAWWAFVVDLVLVLAFVLIGRRSHDESSALVGIATTAWPFVSGLIIGWLGVVGFRWPIVSVHSGVLVWLATVIVGMLLRTSSNQGVAVSFVIVALVFNGIVLLGWRMLADLLAKRRAGAATP